MPGKTFLITGIIIFILLIIFAVGLILFIFDKHKEKQEKLDKLHSVEKKNNEGFAHGGVVLNKNGDMNRKGKYTYIIVCACIVVTAVIIGAVQGSKNKNPTPLAPTATQTRYIEESYAVGIDIPAGDYVAYPSSTYTGKYKVTEDEYGFNILREEYIGSIWTITLQNGEYVFLDKCYLVPILETPSCNDPNFNIHQYEVKDVRLKIGYHVPAGEYVFNASVKVYSDLCETDSECYLKYVFNEFVSTYFDYYTSKYIICNLRDGEYCEVSTAVDYKNFLTLEESKEKVEIKRSGSYKVGVHIPEGLYTIKGYEGNAKIYNDRELINTIYVNKGENVEMELYNGQTVIFYEIDIVRRDDFKMKK